MESIISLDVWLLSAREGMGAGSGDVVCARASPGATRSRDRKRPSRTHCRRLSEVPLLGEEKLPTDDLTPKTSYRHSSPFPSVTPDAHEH